MAYPLKIQRALQILTVAKIPKWLGAPPPYRVLWSLGIAVRPPLFSNFIANAIFSGLSFDFIIGTLRVVYFIVTGVPSPVPATISFFTPTILIALIIAAGLDALKRKARLPKWDEVDFPSRFD